MAVNGKMGTTSVEMAFEFKTGYDRVRRVARQLEREGKIAAPRRVGLTGFYTASAVKAIKKVLDDAKGKGKPAEKKRRKAR